MTQAIDRIRLLNALTQERFTRRHSTPRRPFTVSDCLRIIREQPSALVWIPVSKSLPPPGTQVLCAFEGGAVCTLWQNWASSSNEDPFLCGEALTFQQPRRVTHWMPLPAGPEGEEQYAPLLHQSTRSLPILQPGAAPGPLL